MQTKRCSKCSTEKERNEQNFGRSDRYKDGFRSWCKECERKHAKEKARKRQKQRKIDRKQKERVNARKLQNIQLSCPECAQALSRNANRLRCHQCNIGVILKHEGLEFYGDTTIHIRKALYAQYKRQVGSSGHKDSVHEGTDERVPHSYRISRAEYGA